MSGTLPELTDLPAAGAQVRRLPEKTPDILLASP